MLFYLIFPVILIGCPAFAWLAFTGHDYWAFGTFALTATLVAAVIQADHVLDKRQAIRRRVK